MTTELLNTDLRRKKVIQKMQRLEEKMSATFVSFNIARQDELSVTLQDQNLQSKVTLGTQSLELLRILCSTPLSLSEIASYMHKEETTLKNQLSYLMGKFRDEGFLVTNESSLIARLVENGFLTYIPRAR